MSIVTTDVKANVEKHPLVRGLTFLANDTRESTGWAISTNEAAILAILNAVHETQLAAVSTRDILSVYPQVGKPTITRSVRALGERGYVRSDRDPLDGRLRLIKITAKGRALLRGFAARLAG